MLINGKPTEKISVKDRGLQYGDGLFETIAVIAGRPMLWERHMARLARGERRLNLPAQDKDKLREEANSLLATKGDAVLKILVTRGQGGRGYRPSNNPQITRILSVHEWPGYPSDWYRKGIVLRICRTRIGRSEALAGLKHLNRLEQVLARQEWDDPEIPEGLMLDEAGNVIEGSQSNLFLIKAGILYTPRLKNSGVAGIVREVVLEVADELGVESVITELDLTEVRNADALFITNSLLGVCPVASLEERVFDINQIPAELGDRVNRVCFGSACIRIGSGK